MEKLLKHGESSLTDEELLAILIGSGLQGKNALDLAETLLRMGQGKAWLLKASLQELQALPGIGLSKSCRILAGLQLGRRLTEFRDFQAISLNSPVSVANYFSSVYLTEDREMFCEVLLDTKNKPIRMETISVGTLNRTMVHPREVFRPAIRQGANSLIVAHNHPSGDPEPSPEDIAITRRLEEAGKLLGIPLLDHIVIGRGKFVSLRQRGIFQ